MIADDGIVISELFELDELLGTQDSEADIGSRVSRIVTWMGLDMVQLHEVTKVFTGHLIERYGDACLDFTWIIFNEPDLMRLFWRSSALWNF